MMREPEAGGGQELARLLTRIEAEDPAALRDAVRAEATSGAATHVVGLTGAPGVGKSTLTGAMIETARARAMTVAVLAIDPSSTRTGGAVLGDRVRMLGSQPDPGVFIRSMASRGTLGGLSTTAPAAIAALCGAGHDVVIVETVGTGQSEVDVARIVDTVVVVTAPGMGDGVQALKAGLLEVADLFVVNKADHGGAGQTEAQLRAMVEADSHRDPRGWQPPVVRTVAVRGEGVERLYDAIDDHGAWLRRSEVAQRRRDDRLLQVLRGAVVRQVHDRLAHSDADGSMRRLSERVALGEIGLTEAADLFLDSSTRTSSPA